MIHLTTTIKGIFILVSAVLLAAYNVDIPFHFPISETFHNKKYNSLAIQLLKDFNDLILIEMN